MKKLIQLLPIVLLMIGCKGTVKAPNQTMKLEPIPVSEQQKENLEKGIYFRGNGNKPDWRLKISEKTIEFASLKHGFETLIFDHVEPSISYLDSHEEVYEVKNGDIAMDISILKKECINPISDEKSSYTVYIEIEKKNYIMYFTGCGNYITDSRLHDIWVLEQMNGQKVSLADFTKELPNLEINSSTNQFMGFAGCNRMNGSIFFERGLLRFTNTITTRMACGANNKENEFLKTLQSTTNYKVENLRLTLTNPSGQKLVFKKVD